MSPEDSSRAPGRNPPLPQPKDALVDPDPRNPNGARPPAIPAQPKTTRIDVGSPTGISPHTHSNEDSTP